MGRERSDGDSGRRGAQTNKFRDTRKFAQMNNPRVPRGQSLNPLTGQVLAVPAPPTVELYPRDPLRPPLNSLAQLRPHTPTGFQLGARTQISTRPW